MKKYEPLTTESAWTFDLIHDYYSHLERIATEKYGIDFYPNQIEVITSEQMLDAYSSVGMPINYSHWSFGKDFIAQHDMYRAGQMGLAYEIVINSNPCISLCMEENSMLMQVLVMAHACFGHNSFFKNNYLFKEWTNADSIIDFLDYSKKYISDCEEKYGIDAVEDLLDSCHAIKTYGVDKYKRPSKLSHEDEMKKKEERNEYNQKQQNDLWRTLPQSSKAEDADEKVRFPEEPQENILYFIEKNAPNMETWQREIVRIVRKMSQYFYPQMQTQVGNEGWATFWHYTLTHDLYDEGLITEGNMLEFYTNHTAVVNQPAYNSKFYSGINPYALGFEMFNDIKRVSMEPSDEDLEWFGDQWWVGCGDWNKAIHWAMENFKDESFIHQFLSPLVIRKLGLFSVLDDYRESKLEISAIHETQGYKHVREALSNQYNIGLKIPDIQVYNVDVMGDRTLTLRHYESNKMGLEHDDTIETMKHIRRLWGFDVALETVTPSDDVVAIYEVTETDTYIDIFID